MVKILLSSCLMYKYLLYVCSMEESICVTWYNTEASCLCNVFLFVQLLLRMCVLIAELPLFYRILNRRYQPLFFFEYSPVKYYSWVSFDAILPERFLLSLWRTVNMIFSYTEERSASRAAHHSTAELSPHQLQWYWDSLEGKMFDSINVLLIRMISVYLALIVEMYWWQRWCEQGAAMIVRLVR